MNESHMIPAFLLLLTGGVALISGGCGGFRSALALNNADRDDPRPIENPFGEFYSGADADPDQKMVLRSKKGERSIEIEIPKASQNVTELVIPVSPDFKEGRNTASLSDDSDESVDNTYRDRSPTPSDREITRTFPRPSGENEVLRQEIERDLALVATADETPKDSKSYLAAMDRIKQLYRKSRYEAALIETDELIKRYQTNPRLYEMQGTLLDRLGKPELAMHSWQQALRLDPNNATLRKFIDRKAARRNVRLP